MSQGPAPEAQAHVIANCGQCQTQMTLVIPMFQLMNTPSVSMVVLVHEKAQLCSKCGAGYVPMIKGIKPDGGLDVQWAKVEYKQSPIIVPPTMQQKNIIEKTKTRGLIEP